MKLEEELSSWRWLLALAAVAISIGFFSGSNFLISAAAICAFASFYKAVIFPTASREKADTKQRLFSCVFGLLILATTVQGLFEAMASANSASPNIFALIIAFILIPLGFLGGVAFLLVGLFSASATAKLLHHTFRTPTREEVTLW